MLAGIFQAGKVGVPCDVRQVLSLRGHVSSTGCSSPLQGAVFMGFLRPETY